jgi:uncharacterized protein (DUF1330 family)
MVEILVGVNVVDERGYAQYRREMTPLLEAHGGRFRFDARISEILRSPGETPFNRIFTIRFPSTAELERFFSLPAYLEIRKRLFEPSVSGVQELGKYEVIEPTPARPVD